jgi:hypothetical protein
MQKNVHISAAGAQLFSGVPGVVASVLRHAKKFIYRPLEAQLFSGVPGVVASSLCC